MSYPDDEWQRANMEQIVQQVWEWKHAYYYGRTSVDDATYDLWWRNLLFLEKRYPHLKVTNSPTDAVGAPMEEEQR